MRVICIQKRPKYEDKMLLNCQESLRIKRKYQFEGKPKAIECYKGFFYHLSFQPHS